MGIGIRLVRYLDGRPLWQDEAYIALNVLARTPFGFFQPLDFRQMAPLGFLWIEWVMTHIAGAGEQSFRFLPLVASIIGLIAFARLARRLLDPEMALLATMLAVFSPLLVYFSTEVKSYALDFLFTVLLMHATLDLVEDASNRAWLRWTAVAASSALFTTSAPIFIVACAGALLVSSRFRDPSALLRIAAACVPAVFVFGVHMLTIYHSRPTAEFMSTFWTEWFLTPRIADALHQARHFGRVFWSDVLFGEGFVAYLPPKLITSIVVCSMIGAVALFRRGVGPASFFLLAPGVLVLVASLLRRWPLTPRLLLFAVPAVLILLPAGLSAIVRVLPARFRKPVLAVPSFALVAMVISGFRDRQWQHTELFVDMTQVLRTVSQSAAPQSGMYISADQIAGCIYYLRWHPDHETLNGDPARDDCTLKGLRTIAGEWPHYVGLVPLQWTVRPRVIRPEWLDAEGQRILDESHHDLVVLIGHHRELRKDLPPWLDRAGATRIAGDSVRGMVTLRYRLPGRDSR